MQRFSQRIDAIIYTRKWIRIFYGYGIWLSIVKTSERTVLLTAKTIGLAHSVVAGSMISSFSLCLILFAGNWLVDSRGRWDALWTYRISSKASSIRWLHVLIRPLWWSHMSSNCSNMYQNTGRCFSCPLAIVTSFCQSLLRRSSSFFWMISWLQVCRRRSGADLRCTIMKESRRRGTTRY